MASSRSAHSDSLPNTPCLPHGDAYVKSGSAAGLALEGDRAPVLLFDDFPGNREPHPGALADGFGGEARLKSFLLLLRRHAAAGVRDRDLDHRLVHSGADGDLSF